MVLVLVLNSSHDGAKGFCPVSLGKGEEGRHAMPNSACHAESCDAKFGVALNQVFADMRCRIFCRAEFGMARSESACRAKFGVANQHAMPNSAWYVKNGMVCQIRHGMSEHLTQ